MNINELEQLAKAATPGPWHSPGLGEVHDDNNNCVIVDVCWREEGEFIENSVGNGTQLDADYIAAANPSAIIELIAAYREAVAALVHIQRCIPINGFAQIHHESQTWEQIDASLDTAKRLGVE